jgi:serine/threonine protein kinase
MAFLLFQRIARAAAKHGVKFLLNLVPGAEVVYDMAADVWEDYRRDRQEQALRAELQAAAGAPAEQVRQEAEAAVRAEAAGQPAEVQVALASYLSQVPAAIRRSLRRPSDPSGTTVPATLSLSRPQDLVPLLPSRPPRFKAGDRPVSGRVLEEPLGIGGFGEAWKARSAHLQSKAPVVLKFCLDAAASPALRNEAGVLDRVMQHGQHPGIVPLLDAHLDSDPPCLEYAYVEGGDLGGLIQEMHARGKTTPDAANRLLLRLAEIIASVHRLNPPIIHCDLKPANILVRRSGDGEVGLYVTDFGIGGLATAQAIRETRQPTRSRQELLTEAVRGAYTPLYASPEQMSRPRNEPPDPRDDVHALGVIWFQLLTGDLGLLSIPTDWQEQVEERGLSADLMRLLASCIAPKAEKRLANAVVLVERLGALLAPAAVTPPQAIPATAHPAAVPHSSPQPQRRPGARTQRQRNATSGDADQGLLDWRHAGDAGPVAGGDGREPQPVHRRQPPRRGSFLGRLPGVLPEAGPTARQALPPADGVGMGIRLPGGHHHPLPLRRHHRRRAGQLRRQIRLRQRPEGEISAADHAGGQLPRQRLGPARRPRQRLGVVPRSVRPLSLL